MNKVFLIPLFFVSVLHAGGVLTRAKIVASEWVAGKVVAALYEQPKTATTLMHDSNKAHLSYDVVQRTGTIKISDRTFVVTVHYSGQWDMSLFIQEVTNSATKLFDGVPIGVYHNGYPCNGFGELSYEVRELLIWLFWELLEHD